MDHLVRAGRTWTSVARLDDVGGVLALQARLNAVIAFGVSFIAFDSSSLAVEATAARFGVSLSGNGLPRLWRRALTVGRALWRIA